MKTRNFPKLPLVLLLVLTAICLTATLAVAGGDDDDDDKRWKPPIEVGNDDPSDHGGGDPDNPVPVLGGGAGFSQTRSVDHFSTHIGVSGGEAQIDFLRLLKAAAHVIGSALFL